MARGEIRDAQLGSIIAEEVDLILAAANDSRLSSLKVVQVERKRGGGHFLIFLAPEPNVEEPLSLREMESLLERAANYIRSELAEALNLKRAPQITVIADPRSFPS